VAPPEEADELPLLPDADEPPDPPDADELELELPHAASKKIVITATKTPIADVVRQRRTALISASPS
jgi:hypothetical protein